MNYLDALSKLKTSAATQGTRLGQAYTFGGVGGVANTQLTQPTRAGTFLTNKGIIQPGSSASAFGKNLLGVNGTADAFKNAKGFGGYAKATGGAGIKAAGALGTGLQWAGTAATLADDNASREQKRDSVLQSTGATLATGLWGPAGGMAFNAAAGAGSAGATSLGKWSMRDETNTAEANHKSVMDKIGPVGTQKVIGDYLFEVRPFKLSDGSTINSLEKVGLAPSTALAAPRAADTYGNGQPADATKQANLQAYLDQLIGKAPQVSYTQAQAQADMDRMRSEITQRLASVSGPTAAEQRRRDYAMADLEAERRAGAGSVNASFDNGRHANYLTQLEAARNTAASSAANKAVFDDAASQIVADNAAFAGQLEGGQAVGGDASDIANMMRAEAANQAAFATNNGDATRDQIVELGVGMEAQREAEVGAIARAAAGNKGDFMNEWNTAVTNRENQERQSLMDQLNSLTQQGMSTRASLAGTEAQMAQSRYDALAGLVKEYGGDQITAALAGATNAAANIPADSMLAADMAGNAGKNVSSSIYGAGEGGATVKAEYSGDDLNTAVSGMLAGVNTNDRAAFKKAYATKLAKLRSSNQTADQALYGALTDGGYANADAVFDRLHAPARQVG